MVYKALARYNLAENKVEVWEKGLLKFLKPKSFRNFCKAQAEHVARGFHNYTVSVYQDDKGVKINFGFPKEWRKKD